MGIRKGIRGARATLGVVTVVIAAACGAEQGTRGDGGEGPGLDSLSDGITAGTGVSESGDEDDGAADGLDSGDGVDPAFDVGQADDGTPEPEGGCQRVDFLFVIDNSASMEDQQAALVEAFPGFMGAIQATLTAESDYHVLVTDTDAWGRCDTANPWNGSDPSSDLCNGYVKQTVFDECDRTMGAGVLNPAGDFATNGACTFATNDRYMTAMEPDLAASFACAAQVGVAGHPSERPMDGMVAALAPEINDAGACNAGFLRDDALLVITFMSDDPHYEDAGTPDEWYQAVVDAKLGDPSAVVVLGLTPAWDGCQENNGDTKGSHWAEFVAKWGDHGLHGNICGTAADYVAFFESAVGTIDAACDEYQPPG